MKTIPIYVGTTPIIADTIEDDDGQAIDLTGDTVTLVVQNPAGTQTSYPATINPDQAGHKGQVTITTPVAVSTAQAYWLAWWHVVAPGQTRDTQTFALQILKHGQESPVVVGPCSSWISGADVLAFCPTADPTFVDDAAASATDVMFSVLARLFKGVCQDTIRPTRTGCGCWLSPTFGLPLMWGNWAGYFGWGAADQPMPLGCGYMQSYELASPVSQILQVKIDGSVVDPTTYRVDEERFLVRLDDPVTGVNPGWPRCQNLSAPDSQPGTWSVSYTYGVAPPQLALDAAKQLACELSKSAGGGACELPTGTKRITRQGVTIDRGLLADWSKGGATGLTFVDAAIRAYNPNGLTQVASVYSPDLPRFGRHAGY